MARGIDDNSALAEKPASALSSPGEAATYIPLLAGVLAIVGALAAGYYFAMRPVTLRIGSARSTATTSRWSRP